MPVHENLYGAIEVRGARENNLRGVDVDIPKRRLTVFTGVSGSGKSSLVFGTVAAESQRLINETYSAFLQNFMPNLARPDVDALRNLSAAIVIDQERMGANARSTLGTATDAYSMLRVVFSRLGTPHAGPSNVFSFNDPAGMCPQCEGSGRVSTLDVDAMVDRDRSLNEGAILLPGYAVDSWQWRIFAASGYFDLDVPLRDWTPEQWSRFLEGPSTKVSVAGVNLTYEGLLDRFRRQVLSKDVDSLQPHVRAVVDRVATFAVCGACGGARLNERALASLVHGRSIAECAAMQVSDLAQWLAVLDEPSVAPMVENLRGTLAGLVEIGLGYLSLDRESGTLSGGEAQRVKMVRHLGSALTDITYVFDEPTAGLHPHDVQRMNELLQRLRDKGNTVLVVEHKPEVIAVADHVVDLGPGAGRAGGQVVYEGDVAGLHVSGTVTGKHLERRQELKTDVRTPTGALRIEHATLHNLRDVTVDVPLGVLVAVTGVAGSGKSSLIHGCLPRVDGLEIVDQGAIRGSRRSNPATYTGLLDPVRKAFAKANGVRPALFSANSEGACPECKGLGMIYTDLAFVAGVASVCEVCDGRRFTAEVLGYRLRGRTIDDVFGMSVAEAREFFEEKPVRAVLDSLDDVGLGYVTLGQPLTSLSGGERQRLKLAIHLAGTATRVVVLDEPTTGLHMADVDGLVGLLDQMVDRGRSVIVIEHNLDVVARADWVVDLGPGAGHDGGLVVCAAPPAAVAAPADRSLTGLHLARP
ncbi:MAG: excinuclease ABC subunit UvrA [Actinobacteria bacterium]|nr:excinuclease ABC subunit UvrA [Actinomycetota bacterium]